MYYLWLMKYLGICSLCLFTALLYFGCEPFVRGCGGGCPPLPPYSPEVEISGFAPARGVGGAELRIDIKGSYSGKETFSVYFGDAKATIKSVEHNYRYGSSLPEARVSETDCSPAPCPANAFRVSLLVPGEAAPGEVFIRVEREGEEDQAKKPFFVQKPSENTLVHTNTFGSLSKEQLTGLLTAAGQLPIFEGLDQAASFFRYGVRYDSVAYTTQYKGRSLRASALVAFPEGVPTKDLSKVPFLGLCHGTITRDAHAPTVALGAIKPFAVPTAASNPDGLINLLYGAVASLGYVCVLPDYVGFGASASEVHPYYHAESLARDVIDALQAARAATQKFTSERVYLMGYSQGGYVAMATQRALEAVPIKGLNLRMVVAGAGAYDVEGMRAYLVMQTSYPQPHYLAYVALAYQDIYGPSNVVLGDIFKAPYAARIPGLFNKMMNAQEINGQLTTQMADLLVADFLNADQHDKYRPLLDALVENTLLDWTPRTRLLLYHGTTDTYVPYSNTERTYNQLSARAAEGLLTLRDLPGKDHGTAIAPYFMGGLLAIASDNAGVQARSWAELSP